MYSPAASRLRQDATATVKTRSPLSTPPLSALPGSNPRVTPESPHAAVTGSSSDQLSNIFQAVRQQIERWGENAKWKIDLVLLDNPNSRPASPASYMGSPAASRAPMQQTQGFGVSSPVGHQGYLLPVSRTTQYPMDYSGTLPVPNDSQHYADNLRQQLELSLERQRHLESIIRSQAEQIQQSEAYPPDANKAIETMRSIYMMSEHEQRLRYQLETKLLHKDIEVLSRKLRRLSSTLQTIESMKLSPEDAKLDKDALLEEHQLLRRKLHLAELRLSARDAELEYLYDVVKSYNVHYYPHRETTPSSTTRSPRQSNQQLAHSVPSPARRGPPYLFQQQYSPKMRHEIRPPPQKQQAEQNYNISALESLGIVADRMLNDPEFNKPATDTRAPSSQVLKNKETITESPTEVERSSPGSPTIDTKRSKRSIDSANALLSMPTLMFPQRQDNQEIRMAEADRISEQEQPLKKSRTETPATAVEWTREKDALLNTVVTKYGTDWDAVAREVPGSTSRQCEQRWSQQQQQHTVKPSEPDARMSPSIAALIDNPATTQSNTPSPIHHISPHATPPLAHANESSSASTSHIHPAEGLFPTVPGYRPPSPASTPKGKRRSTQGIVDTTISSNSSSSSTSHPNPM